MEDAFPPNDVTTELTAEIFNRFSGVTEAMLTANDLAALLAVFSVVVAAIWYNKIPFEKAQKWIPVFGLFAATKHTILLDKGSVELSEQLVDRLSKLEDDTRTAFAFWLTLRGSLKDVDRDYSESERTCNHLRDEFQLQVMRVNIIRAKTSRTQLDIVDFFGLDAMPE